MTTARRTTPTLERFVWHEYWPLVDSSYSPMWRLRVDGLLREIVAALGSRRLDRITPRDIDTWRHGLRLSRGSAAVRLNLLRAVLRRAYEVGHLTRPTASRRQTRRPRIRLTAP
jgi:hypothetical protein